MIFLYMQNDVRNGALPSKIGSEVSSSSNDGLLSYQACFANHIFVTMYVCGHVVICQCSLFLLQN